MEKKRNPIFVLTVLCLLGTYAAAATSHLEDAQNKICEVLQNIYELLLYIAGGLGALVIVIQGVTWVTSADDAKARKGAKVAVVHVIIGLIIISIALVLVAMVLPEGSDCVQNWPGWPGNTT